MNQWVNASRWLDDKSRMNREIHVRIRESVRVKFPRATRPVYEIRISGRQVFHPDETINDMTLSLAPYKIL